MFFKKIFRFFAWIFFDKLAVKVKQNPYMKTEMFSYDAALA